MKVILDALRELQSIDSEAYEIEKAKKDIETKVRELVRIRDAIVEDLDEKKNRLAEAEEWYAEKNAELEEDKRKINASRGKLAGVKKNKEYQAIMKEIENLRKTNEKKEEEILKLLEAIERFRESTGEQEKKLVVIEAEITISEKEVAGEVAKLEKEISLKSDAKAVHLAKVPRRYLAQYKRIFKNRNGVAVVDATGGKCSGCNIRVPPQLTIIMLRGQSIETCPNCSRFLFVAPHEAVEEETEA